VATLDVRHTTCLQSIHMRRSARLLAATSCGLHAELSTASSACTSSPLTGASSAAISASNSPRKAEQIDRDGWTVLCSTRELSCALTLESGQVFAWRRHPTQSATWLGVVGRRVFALRERDNVVQCRCLHPSDCTWLSIGVRRRISRSLLLCPQCRSRKALGSCRTTSGWMCV
jgi:hypothetical protein